MKASLLMALALALVGTTVLIAGEANAAYSQDGTCYGTTIDDGGYNYSCEGVFVNHNGMTCLVYYYNGNCNTL